MALTMLRGLEQRLIVDTSEGRPVYLLVAEKGSYLRLSASTYQLLRQVSRGTSFERLAEALTQQGGKPVTVGELEAAYQKVIARVDEIEARAGQAKGAFWFRRQLLPQTLVVKIASVLSAAFHPAMATFLVLLIAVAAGLVAPRASQAAPTQFWASYGLFLVSVLAHELGHASACARYGAKPSEIGLTVYFIYPSFYSDVSAAWELKRWQRMVVDLGGVYFQLVFGAGCAIAYLLTGWGPLLGALLFIAGSCLFSLNPILKFDGYWVIADALGVTNLGQQPARIVRHFFRRLFGRPSSPLPWPPRVTASLAVYAALSFSFWAWFLVRLGPFVWAQAIRFADISSMLGRQLFSTPTWPDQASLRELGTAAFTLFFPLVMVGRLVWSLLVTILAKLRARRAVAPSSSPARE